MPGGDQDKTAFGQIRNVVRGSLSILPLFSPHVRVFPGIEVEVSLFWYVLAFQPQIPMNWPEAQGVATKLQLFRRTSQLEQQIDSFFDKVSESSVVYRLAVRLYLREGMNDEFQERLDRVNAMESEADQLRRDIERHLYSHTLIPDSRGDVLGLIETIDQLLSQFEGSLWSFAIEQPEIPEEFNNGYRKLTNMVVKAANELVLGGRAFFHSPHDVPVYNHKVMLYEREADVISTNLKKAIFASDLDLARRIHLREFVEQIDAVADVAEDVSDRLAIYAIKRLV